jgi:hypothetical protein
MCSSRFRHVPTAGIALCAVLVILLSGLRANAGFAPLPADGSQVNDDPANSIDPNQDAGLVDVAGGTVTAGKLQVPCATFARVGGRG